MKVLVTGGAGFIGSHLVDHYVALGYEVTVIDDLSTGNKNWIHPQAKWIQMNLADPDLITCIQQVKPDLINHQAGQVNVRKSVQDPLLDIRMNLIGTLQLLEAAGKVGIKKMIFASSGGAIYGRTTQVPIPETATANPISPYGIHKLTAERYVAFYAERYGFSWTTLRYSNVYGPRQNPHGESGVISIFIDRLLKGEAPIIYGDGQQIRDYIHVTDIIAANMLATQSSSTRNQAYNVGTGIGTSLNQLLQKLSPLFPYAKPARYQSPQAGDLEWNVLAVDKLRALGWNPAIGLQEGLWDLIPTI